MVRRSALGWASFVLALAAAYNVVWGGLVVLFPDWCLGFLELRGDANRPLVQCIGMIVGVYGLGYGIAATDPARYWPLVLVGLAGKLFGPIGGVWAVVTGDLPPAVLWVNVANDLVWWLPFGWILLAVRAGAFPSAVPKGADDERLYPRVLGARFDALAPALRRFHGETPAPSLSGRFRVRRGSGWLRNAVADLQGFPPDAQATPVRLEVAVDRAGETWRRRFGDLVLESSQWAAAGCVAEHRGGVTLYLEPRVEKGALVLESARATLFGLPLAPVFAPRAFATVEAAGEELHVLVQLELAPIGLLVEYAGAVGFAAPAGPEHQEVS